MFKYMHPPRNNRTRWLPLIVFGSLLLFAGMGCGKDKSPQPPLAERPPETLAAPTEHVDSPKTGDTQTLLTSPDGHWSAHTYIAEDETLTTSVSGNTKTISIESARALGFSADSQFLLLSVSPPGYVAGLEILELRTPWSRRRVSNRSVHDEVGFTADTHYIGLPAEPDAISWEGAAWYYGLADGRTVVIEPASGNVSFIDGKVR